MAVSIYEYDEELHMKTEREIWYNTGVEQCNQLTAILIDLGRLDDLKRATQDRAYQEQLMHELLPSLESSESK